jgi:hypothetical protein
VKVLSADSEDPDAIAAVMAQTVGAEVAEQVASNPMIMALAAVGIKTPADVTVMLDYKALGEQYVMDLRVDAKQQAIRAYGPKAGQAIGASVDNLGHREAKIMRDSWSAEADAKFALKPDGSGPDRSSAPRAVAVTVETDAERAEPKTFWERLDAKQQKIGTQMGAKTADSREKFAAQYFANKGDAAAVAWLAG